MNIETVAYVPALFQRMIANIWIKLLSVFSYVIAYPFFDETHKLALYALFFLIFTDLFTGLILTVKKNEHIKSFKIFRTALKITIYYTMISAGYLTELAGLQAIPIDEALIIVLAVTELVSILENCALMGYVVPKKLLNKLKSFRDEQ